MSVSVPDFILAPFVEVYYDFDEANGVYTAVGIEPAIHLNDMLAISGGFSTGFASHKYNNYYFGGDRNTWNDGNIWFSVPLSIGESLTITPAVQYSWLWDADIYRGAAASGALFNSATHHGDHFLGSLNVSYAF